QAFADEMPSYYEQDEDVDQAAWLFQQPPALSQPSAAAPSPRRTGQRAGRLASVPNMLGDCGMTTANVTLLDLRAGRITASTFMLPMVGGSRTAKIAENDIAMPVDRVFFNYNHYSDIFQMHSQQMFPPGSPSFFRQEPIDRY